METVFEVLIEGVIIVRGGHRILFANSRFEIIKTRPYALIRASNPLKHRTGEQQ